MDKNAIYVEMMLVSLWMEETRSWPVMSVRFPYAELATSMNAEKEIKSVLSARPDSDVSRVCLLTFLFHSSSNPPIRYRCTYVRTYICI